MRVLLTGHQGYLGTVMAPILAAAGPRGDRPGQRAVRRVHARLASTRRTCRALAVDLRDVTVEQLAGFDAVVHMAALSNDPLGSLAPEITYDINHHASTRLARLAKDAGVGRFVYASTCSVYGAQSGDELVDEDAPLKPVTPYAESKVRVEDDLAALADADFVPVSMRNATAFGFSPRLRADIVLNNLVGHAVLTERGQGAVGRHAVAAAGARRGHRAAVVRRARRARRRGARPGLQRRHRAQQPHGRRDRRRPWSDAVPGAKLLITGETGNDPRSYRVDFSRARKELGFEARLDDPGRRRRSSPEEYRERDLTREQFDQRFTRLAVLAARQQAGELDDTMRVRG